MKIAAAYIRVSTDDQLEYSPDSQLEVIRKYAKANDYIIPDEYIYIEEGISGKTANKRPQFIKMIGVAKTQPKPFDAILLWKFSRFARNREDSIVYKSMLRKQLGIDVISVSESLGDDKMSILIEAMIEAMDEYYSINLAEEVKRGMTEKASRGECCSIPPFGYTLENKLLVPHPEESLIIKKAFEDYNNGVGMLRIAKNLNSLGIRTHRGNKIENRTVEYWLNNPVYNGKIRWTPTGATKRNYHNPDSMIVKGKHEAIISNELWESVQERLAHQKEIYRKWYKPSENISHWLVGITKCGICGGPMVNCNGYLYCNNKSKGTCPGNGSISLKKLDKVIIEQLEAFLNSDIRLRYSDGFIKTNVTSNSNDLILKQIEKAKIKLMRIKEAYASGVDTLDEYKENKTKINAEIKELETKLESEEPANIEEQEQITRNAIKNALPFLKNTEISAKEKNELARSFIRSITKAGENGRYFDIVFR